MNKTKNMLILNVVAITLSIAALIICTCLVHNYNKSVYGDVDKREQVTLSSEAQNDYNLNFKTNISNQQCTELLRHTNDEKLDSLGLDFDEGVSPETLFREYAKADPSIIPVLARMGIITTGTEVIASTSEY